MATPRYPVTAAQELLEKLRGSIEHETVDGYQYPTGIYVLTPDDGGARHRQRQGYRIGDPPDDLGCEATLYGAISNHQLWDVFEMLSYQLPDRCYRVVTNEANEEQKEHVWLSGYMDREEAVAGLRRYAPWLINDGFTGFGLAAQGEGWFHEVFVDISKHVLVYTRDLASTVNLLLAARVYQDEDMTFLHQHPIVRANFHSGYLEEAVRELDLEPQTD